MIIGEKNHYAQFFDHEVVQRPEKGLVSLVSNGYSVGLSKKRRKALKSLLSNILAEAIVDFVAFRNGNVRALQSE